MVKPEIGKTYKFYDDGKVSYSRQYDATVLRIISKEEAKSIMFPLYWDYWRRSKTTHINDAGILNEKKSLYDVWKEEVAEDDSTYNTFTDCFVECSIPEYDDDTIWFVRATNNGWFSLDIQSDWQSGRLDIDNHITEDLDRLIITMKYLDEQRKNETNSD